MATSSYLLYAACFTQGKAPQLQVLRMDGATGAIEAIQSFSSPLQNPLYVETDQASRFLYVADFVKEVDGVAGGAIAAMAIDPETGKVSFINRVSSGGAAPCYISVAPDRRYLMVANYGDGVISMLPINPDGSLAPPVDKVRHEGAAGARPNAHCITFDPNARFALAADLGVDRIFSYHPDGGTMKLRPTATPVQTEKGAGPRHLAFHPNGRFVYCQTEFDDTVIAMRYDGQTGAAEIIQIEPSLPADYTGKNDGADIHVHPNGRFLYSTNRGHDSLAIFRIDQTTGRITAQGHEPTRGSFPRDFLIDPSGTWLVVGNEKSSTLVIFRIDPSNGKLTSVGSPVAVANPAGLKLIPA